MRVQVDPAKLAAMGMTLEDVRGVLVTATVNAPKGSIDGEHQAYTVYDNDQMTKAAQYNNVVLAYRNGAPVRVRDIGRAIDGPENRLLAGWQNGKRGILLIIFKQPGANVIDTVERIKAALPRLEASIPPSIHVSTIMDRTLTIRASVADVEFTLMLAVGLVVMVIFLFLRNVWATIIPSITMPVALICTFAVMYLLDYSLDNLSLMALTIAVGFVVDDAIVMLENIFRHIEDGMKPMEAAHQGRRRNRLHHRLDQLLADRRVHPAAADGRHRRAAVPRIRRDRDHRGAGLGLRLPDADADDVLALPAPRHQPARLAVPRDRGLLHRPDRRLPAHAGHRAAPPLHHAAGVPRRRSR